MLFLGIHVHHSLAYKFECEPSQNGGLLVCLHMHMAAGFDSSALNTLGDMPLPLCEPSHQGWFADLPQAHQANDFPSSKSTIMGVLPAICPFSIVVLFCGSLNFDPGFILYDKAPDGHALICSISCSELAFSILIHGLELGR